MNKPLARARAAPTPDPTVEFVGEIITPEIADRYLETSVCGRRPSAAHVRYLAGAILRGEWKFNGDAIRFDVDGQLIDGQHRLLAVIAADRPIYTAVVRRLPKSVFDTIDVGRIRTSSDVLSIAGERDVYALAAMTKFTFYYDLGLFSGRKPTPAQIEKTLEAHPLLREWAQRVTQINTISSRPTIVAALLALAEEHHPSRIKAFYEALISGANLAGTDPALVLRNRLTRDRGSASKLGPVHIAQVTIDAFNAWIGGGRRLRLQTKVGSSEIPRLVRES